MKIVKLVLKIIIGIFLFYAVIFSIAASVALFITARAVLKPVYEVKRLKDTNPPETIYMRAQRKLLAGQNEADTLMHIFIPLDSISPHLVKAVLAAEDDGFYMHPGFDISAIASAVEHNRLNNGIKRGASTITQQLAKNLFAGSEKSFERKYKELMYAVLMEWFLGKDRILELYINYAQWGKNIFGCEAAARHYYHKSSSEITVSQAAHMAAVLAKPSTLNPLNGKSVLLQKRLSVIANNMFRRNAIDTTLWSNLGGDDSMLLVKNGYRPHPDSIAARSQSHDQKKNRRNHF